MRNVELYKEFYFKEIERKNELNNIINVPILIITAIISVNFYVLSQTLNDNILILVKSVAIGVLLGILFSICFLLKSFSNFFKTHTYKELTNMNSILNYEKKLIEEQADENVADLLFLDYLKDELADCAAHNFIINKTRTQDIAKSKKGIFVSIIFTLILLTIYIVSILNINIMAEENEKPVEKPTTTVQRPTSEYIQNGSSIPDMTTKTDTPTSRIK